MGSWTTQSNATMSETSGVVSRPPSPTTSTGSPAASSASMTAGNCERLRQSTAAEASVRAPRPSSQCWRIHPATCAASSSAVSRRAACTRPGPAPGLGRSICTATGDFSRSGSDVRLATCRIASSLRQLVESGSSSARPEPSANSTGKRVSVVALAPRQP